MDNIIVIQARTTSSRFPGKVLLNFRGFPLAILAARRAATTGRKVLLATSRDPSDDALASAAREYGIDCYRGSLDDVLERFTTALGDLSDDTMVTRLTGDNIVPDGNLIDEVVAAFKARGLDYITTTDSASGLPYGVSVEVTRLRHLREADRRTESRHEREHVTPYIAARFGRAVFRTYASLGMENFRATIDCIDDLASMHRIFPVERDPLQVGWKEIVQRVPLGLYQPSARAAVSDMVMGTAQLGMPYGIANRSVLTDSERQAMIKTAVGNGVRWLDTARTYGKSEHVIGDVLGTGWQGRFGIVTKLSPLQGLPEELTAPAVHAAVESSVLRSCLALGQQQVDSLLLHRAAHLTAWNGAAWRRLRKMLDEGRIGVLGVSIQTPDELMVALDNEDVGHVQLPFNILDRRWEPCLERLRDARRQRGFIVHARSALLQGLLASDDPTLWRRAKVGDASRIRDWLAGLVREFGRDSVPDLCIAWARAQDWIDGVVVGSDNLSQLEQNIRYFRYPALSEEARARILATRPQLDPSTLNPTTWTMDVFP